MLLYSHWLALSLPTRIKIAETFGIIKKNPTHVDSNVITHDGYLVKDIEAALTVEALQNYLNMPTQTDLKELWTRMVDKIEGREVFTPTTSTPPIVVLPPAEANQFAKEYKKRKGRPKKK